MGKKGNKLASFYFAQPRRRRRVIGRVILLLLVMLLGFGIYEGYTGARWLYRYFKGEQPVSITINNDEYPGNWNHRHFDVEKKHPERMFKSYPRYFDDLNATQLTAAQRLGITPLQNREQLSEAKGLVKISDTKYYVIDNLTQSVPYLVPDAADFLTDLGRLVQAYNGSESRFIITSVLRTQADVKKLSRNNVNASKNSCHCYGTTVDIVYTRFDNKGKTTDGQLKLDLARALADMREAGYCYVVYERRQPCFHVTVRPRQ